MIAMDNKKRQQLDLLHKLATRLPWIVVLGVLLTAIVVYLQLYLGWI